MGGLRFGHGWLWLVGVVVTEVVWSRVESMRDTEGMRVTDDRREAVLIYSQDWREIVAGFLYPAIRGMPKW